MNYFNLVLRAAIAIIAFAIGIALVGGHEKTEFVVPALKATRADALDAELEAMNAFYKLIESDRKDAESRVYVEPLTDYSNEAPEGDFTLAAGSTLKAFDNISGFYVVLTEYDVDKLKSYQVTPSGALWGMDIEYSLKDIVVSPHRISFTTKPGPAGISFAFNGKVSRKQDIDYEFWVIKGTLVKYQDGKEIYRFKVEFEEMSGC